MLGLALFEADRCPGCGNSLSISTDPNGDAKDYMATKHVCLGCEMLSIKQAADPEKKHAQAHLWTVDPLS